MSDEKKTVQVRSKFPNGIRLHVMKRLEKPLSEGAPPFKDMGFIDLQPYRSLAPLAAGQAPRTHSLTDVDKELFDIWHEENKDNEMVKSGAIKLMEEPKPQDAPTDRPVEFKADVKPSDK